MVESARLESVCSESYRRFESCSLRQLNLGCSVNKKKESSILFLFYFGGVGDSYSTIWLKVGECEAGGKV